MARTGTREDNANSAIIYKYKANGCNRLLCPDEALAADPNAAVPGFAQIAQLVIFEGTPRTGDMT